MKEELGGSLESNGGLKKYLLYSVSFHAAVLIAFFLFGDRPVLAPTPATQITMIRLTRGTGSLESPMTEKTGGQAGTAPTSEEKPTVAPPPEPPKPKVETPPVAIKPPTPKPPPSAKVEKPAPPQAPKPPRSAVNLAEKPPVKPPPPKVPSENDAKIAQALGQVKEELKEREALEKSASTPNRSSGSGSAAGTGEGSSPGYGAPGGEVQAVDPEKARYSSSVRSKIIREWVRTSSGSQDQILRATVVVRINASGSVISKSLSRRSGDSAFDNSALRAVERASPFPPPPDSVRGEAVSEGFVVTFSSRMLGKK